MLAELLPAEGAGGGGNGGGGGSSGGGSSGGGSSGGRGGGSSGGHGTSAAGVGADSFAAVGTNPRSAPRSRDTRWSGGAVGNAAGDADGGASVTSTSVTTSLGASASRSFDPAVRYSGVCEFWHAKGWGRIVVDSGLGKLFVHNTAIRSVGSGQRRRALPRHGKVTFLVGSNEKGPMATDVSLEEDEV